MNLSNSEEYPRPRVTIIERSAEVYAARLGSIRTEDGRHCARNLQEDPEGHLQDVWQHALTNRGLLKRVALDNKIFLAHGQIWIPIALTCSATGSVPRII